MNGDKRKFLFVSITGLISDIAWQVAKEGHEVRYCIEDEKERDVADGFVPKVRDWEREVDWADVIVFDDTLGQGEKAQALRAKGKLVVGGTPYTDRLEDDRSFGQEELKKLFREKLTDFAATLEGKERFIFEKRLIADEPLTLQNIGDHYGVSRERARQIEASLIERIRKHLREQIPDFDLVAAPKN